MAAEPAMPKLEAHNVMKTNFDRYRRCLRGVWIIATMLLLLMLWQLYLYVRSHDWSLGLDLWFDMLLSSMKACEFLSEIELVLLLLAIFSSKCPHCGKSVMSKGFSYERGKRISRGLPIRCPHCGKEVETASKPA